jgi:hypothetical protein
MSLYHSDSDSELYDDVSSSFSPVMISFEGRTGGDIALYNDPENGLAPYNGFDEHNRVIRKPLIPTPDDFDSGDETELVNAKTCNEFLEIVDMSSPPRPVKGTTAALEERLVPEILELKKRINVIDIKKVVQYGNPVIELTKRGTRKAHHRDQIECLCGGVYRRSCGTQHRQSDVHRKFLERCFRTRSRRKPRVRPEININASNQRLTDGLRKGHFVNNAKYQESNSNVETTTK